MNKGLLIGIIVVVVIIIIGGFLIFRGGGTSSSAMTPPPIPNVPTPSVNNPTPSNSGSSGAATHSVDIANFAFSPASLTINAGDSVTWTNKDSTAHTVTSDSGSELNSGTLRPGDTYSQTFNTKGEFDYHCSIHTSMKAKVIVQ